MQTRRAVIVRKWRSVCLVDSRTLLSITPSVSLARFSVRKCIRINRNGVRLQDFRDVQAIAGANLGNFVGAAAEHLHCLSVGQGRSRDSRQEA